MSRSPFYSLPADVQAVLRREVGGGSLYVPGRERLDGAEVRRMRSAGRSVTEIARALGVSRQAVYGALERD